MAFSLFPQDEGTGVTELDTDWDDAAGFAQLAHIPNATDFVVSGFDFTVNYSAETIDVSEGVARVSAPSATTKSHTSVGGTPARTLRHVTFVAQTEDITDRALIQGVRNWIYLVIDPSVSDSVDVKVQDTDIGPAAPHVLLGNVDLPNQTADDSYNRAPDAVFEEVRATDLSVTTSPTGGTDAVRLEDLDAYALDSNVPNPLAIQDDSTSIATDVATLNFTTDLTATDNGNGTVTVEASASAGDTHTAVSDDGTAILSDVATIDFGDDLTVVDNGDQTATINSIATTDLTVADDGTDLPSTAGRLNFGTMLSASVSGGTATIDADTGSIDAADLSSSSATGANQAPLSDGTGGVVWDDIPTAADFDNHTGDPNAHHARYSDSEAINAVSEAGINAGTLDGLDSSQFVRTDQASTINGALNIHTNTDHLELQDTDQPDQAWVVDHNGTLFRMVHADRSGASTTRDNQLSIDYSTDSMAYAGSSFSIGGNDVLTTADEGSLNAGFLGGTPASDYLSVADEGSLNAGSLGGVSADGYLRSDADDVASGNLSFTGSSLSVNVDNHTTKHHLYLQTGNNVDGGGLLIDSDGDANQDDDALHIRGGTDPTSLTDADTAMVVKGDHRVGIGTYSPTHALDVSGSAYVNNEQVATQPWVDNNFVRPGEDTGSGTSIAVNVLDLGATRHDDSNGRPDFTNATAVNEVMEQKVNEIGQDTENHICFIIPEGAYLWSANCAGQQGRFEIGTMGTVEIRGFGQPRLYMDKNVQLVDTSGTTPVANGLPEHFMEIGDAGTVKDIFIENLNFVISNWAGAPLGRAITNDGFDIDTGLGRFITEGNAVLRRIWLTGRRHRYQDISGDGTVTPGESDEVGGRYTFLPVARPPAGRLTVEHLHMDWGGTAEGTAVDQVGHAIGIGAETAHTGTAIFRDCSVQHFVDNGYYVKTPTGKTIVENCYAKNNSNSNYRGAGQTIFRNCELEFDATNVDGTAWSNRTTGGFTLEHDGTTLGDTIKVKDCDMYIDAPIGTGSPSIMQVLPGTSRAEILNNTVINTSAGNENSFLQVENYSGNYNNMGVLVDGNTFISKNANASGHAPKSNRFVYSDRWKTTITNNMVELGNHTDWVGVHLMRDRCIVEGNHFEHGASELADMIIIEAGRRDHLIANNEFTSGRINVKGDQQGPLRFVGNNFDDAVTHQFGGAPDGSGIDEPSGWHYAANEGIDGTPSSWNVTW